MGKIKLTKGELKRQRDALSQYRRYLPTLQLKKQQLQLEMLKELSLLEEKAAARDKLYKAAIGWAGLLAEGSFDFSSLLRPGGMALSRKNIAGLDIPVFESMEFAAEDHDLFTTALWVDGALSQLRQLVELKAQIGIIEQGVMLLRRELRITSQRVNLFEKVKIPQAEEAVRSIKIYIGDQMANAVGRAKAAKRKIEALELQPL